jgi:hypothetical protein
VGQEVGRHLRGRCLSIETFRLLSSLGKIDGFSSRGDGICLYLLIDQGVIKKLNFAISCLNDILCFYYWLAQLNVNKLFFAYYFAGHFSSI